MNLRDSEVVCGLLKEAGFQITEEMDSADVVIFNTCSVRQHAEDKVWSEIGRIAKLSKKKVTVTKSDSHHKTGTVPIIGLVGCMAQNYKESAFERAPAVDFVVGPSDIGKIPEIIKKLIATKVTVTKSRDSHLFTRKIWETEGEIRPDEIYHTGFYEDKEHAFVVISEGCSNFCSYCVVPHVRGALHHRNYEEIIREIEQAIDKGIAKITLLGQNVNAYGVPVSRFAGSPVDRNVMKIASPPAADRNDIKNTISFINLLELVNKVPGLKEFSFITSHPKDTTVELFEAIERLDKLKKYLHLPVQSGSDRILKLMNRGYTRKYYLELAQNYRKIVKSGILTTDVIVGFPSETESDFTDTYNLMKEVRFDAGYLFKYSPRPHTQAANMPDDVAKEEKERRHALVLELQKEISKSLKGKE